MSLLFIFFSRRRSRFTHRRDIVQVLSLQAPRRPRVKTNEEEACARHNREIEKEIALAHQKRAAYLSRHAKALAPFVEERVLEKIRETAAGYTPSEKVLTPVDNQPETIKAVLREYQLEGIRWMVRMFDDGCSCILADEMAGTDDVVNLPDRPCLLLTDLSSL